MTQMQDHAALSGAKTAALLNISRAHANLLRSVIGEPVRQVLAFWLALDDLTAEQWADVGTAAWNTPGGDRSAAEMDAGMVAVWAAAADAAPEPVTDAQRSAARAAAWASNEIQRQGSLRERGEPFVFLPMFGFANPESIPPLPAGYGTALQE